MLQFDIEKCLEQCDGHFDLVLIASQRARELSLGQKPKVERNGNKNSLLSLRELEHKVLDINDLRTSLIGRLNNETNFMKELINKESNILEEVNSANFLHSESELLSDADADAEESDTIEQELETELLSDTVEQELEDIESDKEEI
jgi:DNA-directed RNA polymerase subunit omega